MAFSFPNNGRYTSSMQCQRCQKPLRSGNAVKCEDCQSRFHVKCVASRKDMEGGDRGYQWKCAVCHHPAGRSGSQSHILLKTINQLSEKFEMVNKIQLPKLNSDLLLLKSTADRIVQQNEDILAKIDLLSKVDHTSKVVEPRKTDGNSRCHRRRPLNLARVTATQDNDEVPIIAASEKCIGYKTRRRSYHLHKVFLLMNRKLLRTRNPGNKSPR